MDPEKIGKDKQERRYTERTVRLPIKWKNKSTKYMILNRGEKQKGGWAKGNNAD